VRLPECLTEPTDQVQPAKRPASKKTALNLSFPSPHCPVSTQQRMLSVETRVIELSRVRPVKMRREWKERTVLIKLTIRMLCRFCNTVRFKIGPLTSAFGRLRSARGFWGTPASWRQAFLKTPPMIGSGMGRQQATGMNQDDLRGMRPAISRGIGTWITPGILLRHGR
jgi:hypothetical protein